jgi:ABC-2 type transport system permease protein
MIATLASLTLRGLLNRRRTLLLILLGALIVVVAAIYRVSNSSETEATGFTAGLLADFGLAVLLPLVAVIIGTAAIGSELDDGTIIYLLAKPVPRWMIVLAKLTVSWLVIVALVSVPMFVAGMVGSGDVALSLAYAVASALGALEYTAIFLALSVMTSRALIIGLAYVVIWEGVVAGLFAGTRLLSVRQHALAVAEAIGPQGAARAELAIGSAVAVAVVVTVLATIIAIQRLRSTELRGETA